jgi:hypothetical protein
MATAQDRWWIIGSAAVALHLDNNIPVSDVDVMLSVADAKTIKSQLGLQPEPAVPHPLFRSEEYFMWSANAIPVEFMANFAVRAGGRWEQVAFNTRQIFTLAGQPLYAPDRMELSALLKLFGRPKDLARLAMLKDASF